MNATAIGNMVNLTAGNATVPFQSTISTWTFNLNIELGAAAMILNGLVTFTIFFYKNLREQRELLMFSSLTIGDCAMGTVTFAQNIFYSIVITGPTYMDTPLNCMLSWVPNVVGITQIMTPHALLVLSIDRLICVCSMKVYLKLGKKYLMAMLGIPSFIVVAQYIAQWVMAAMLPQTKSVQMPMCSYGHTVFQPVYVFVNNYMAFLGVVSVLVYMAVIVAFYSQPVSEFQTLAKIQVKRQRRMTKVLGVMSIVTLVCFAIPTTLLSLSISQAWATTKDVTSALRFIWATFGILNILIYLAKPSEVRTRMFQLIGVDKLRSIFIRGPKNGVVSIELKKPESIISGSTGKQPWKT